MAGQSDNSPSEYPFSITPNDNADLAQITRAVILANGGTLKITRLDNSTDTLTLPAGSFPMKVRRVWATGTTATGISGLA
jgi:hypothetical protein